MTVCTECQSVEPKIRTYILEGLEFDGCAECDSEENTLKYFSEDDPNEDR